MYITRLKTERKNDASDELFYSNRIALSLPGH